MADNKFLDQAGLQIVWDKIVAKFADKVSLTELESEFSDLARDAATKSEVEQAIQQIESTLDGDFLTTEETEQAIQQAIADLIDGAPDDLNTLKELSDLLKQDGDIIVELQKDVDDNAAAIAKLEQSSEPIYDDTKGRFFANGQSIAISEGSNSDLQVTYQLGARWQTMSVPANTIFMGGGDGTEKNVEYPGTSITLNSGTVKSIYGGGLNACTVGTSSIVINGGTVTEGVLGGGGSDNKGTTEGGGNVASANIVINGGNIYMVYGGGQNITNVGVVDVVIYDGAIYYLTTGGSNGSTGSGEINVYGGTIQVWQAVNRGTLENSVMMLDGGNVVNMYCIGENDRSVTGTVRFSTVSLRHGTVTNLYKGDQYATGNTVKGEYREGIVTNDVDNILNTFNKIADTELEAMTEQDILNICK